jgi:hypothetical protein
MAYFNNILTKNHCTKVSISFSVSLRRFRFKTHLDKAFRGYRYIYIFRSNPRELIWNSMAEWNFVWIEFHPERDSPSTVLRTGLMAPTIDSQPIDPAIIKHEVAGSPSPAGGRGVGVRGGRVKPVWELYTDPHPQPFPRLRGKGACQFHVSRIETIFMPDQ